MSKTQDWQSLPRAPFGDSPEMSDQLLALVMEGKKRATCWSAAEGEKGTVVGSCWVALDGKGRPRAVLETIELAQKQFDQVNADFAADEGEGDLSLAYWRDAHRDFFSRNGGFTPDMLLWCERFEMIEVLPLSD